jgi:hypothetical protein
MAGVIQILRSLVAGNRPSGRLYGEPYVNFADNQFGIFDSSNVARDLIGVPMFSSGANYPAGAAVNYLGIIYFALVAVSPGVFNPAQWVQPSSPGQAYLTGDLKPSHNPTAPSGWVLWADGTVGDASSGSGIRANADTQNLFNLYYNSYTDANCPILTSTGTATTRSAQGTAAAAWAAHCRMTLPKGAGRAIGNRGTGTGLTVRGAGDAPGAETSTPAISTTAPHTHTGIVGAGAGFYTTASAIGIDSNLGTGSNNPAVQTAATGSGSPFSIMQPTTFCYWMIKL